jgi:hypothetical protein
MNIRKIIREQLEGIFLYENKIYPKNIVDLISKRFEGGLSDDDLNKIAISGLFRNMFTSPQEITKEKLDSEFNSWKNKSINFLLKTKTFVDNKDLATKYIDAYVNNIRKLGDKAQPFSIKTIEKSLVDIVNNNNWIKSNNIIQKNDIYNPNPDDIAYENENVVVLNSNTKAKCVMYGDGESWCIGKPEFNYYNTYRINYRATPYHVLQKNVDKNSEEHKFVIMNYGNGRYAIADRGNSKRHGGSDQATSWSNIESQLPNLQGLEKHFPYREVTEDEKRYETILIDASQFKGDDFQGYIDGEIKNLVINGSQVSSEDFIRDIASQKGDLSKNQLLSLRESIMDSLIESGYFNNKFTHNIFIDGLKSKQQRRVSSLLNSSGIFNLLKDSKEPDRIINILFSNPEFIKNLDSNGIVQLFKNSTKPEILVTILGDKGQQFFKNLNQKVFENVIWNILNGHKEPDRIINILFSNPEFIKNLDSNSIKHLVYYSKEPEKIKEIIQKYGKWEEFISSIFLTKDSIERFLTVDIKFSDQPEKIIYTIGDKARELIGNISAIEIQKLLSFNSNADKLINILLNNSQFIENIDLDKIKVLFKYSREPEKIKSILQKYGKQINESSLRAVIREGLQALFEDITIPIEIGDEILGGKFKNKKVKVKEIGKNDKGDITINGKPLLRFRIPKK